MSEYEDLFFDISEALTQFAADHCLLIEKYYHDAPVWSLCFAHPRRGQAKIDVTHESENRVQVQSVWWIDDFDCFIRNLKWGSKSSVLKQPGALKNQLRKQLADALSWEFGEWSQVATGYESIWGRFNKAQFEKMTPDWPEPKL